MGKSKSRTLNDASSPLWTALSPRRRQTVGQAIEFVENLGPVLLTFSTLGNPKQIALAWLVKEIERTGTALRP